jgi:hypothetical protein
VTSDTCETTAHWSRIPDSILSHWQIGPKPTVSHKGRGRALASGGAVDQHRRLAACACSGKRTDELQRPPRTSACKEGDWSWPECLARCARCTARGMSWWALGVREEMHISVCAPAAQRTGELRWQNWPCVMERNQGTALYGQRGWTVFEIQYRPPLDHAFA